MWGNSVSSMPATQTQSNSRPLEECTVISVTAWPSSVTVSRSVRRRTHSMKSASESPRSTRTGSTDSSSPTVGAAKSDSSASWVCTNSSTTPRNSWMFSTRPRASSVPSSCRAPMRPALVDDHLDDLAQIAPVGGAVLDDLDELPDGIARRGADAPDRPPPARPPSRTCMFISRPYWSMRSMVVLPMPRARHVDDALGRDVVGRVHRPA